MKLSVLIRPETDAMTRTRCARQECRGRPTVEVVNHVVVRSSKLASNARSCHQSATLQHDHVVDVWMIIQNRCDPILDQNVYLCVWEKSFQREERRCCQNRVADRSESNDQHLAH